MNLGQEKCSPMLFYHAFTGCDVVSAFRGRGKKTAWQTWALCPEVGPVFSKLSQYPPTMEDADLNILEKFVVTMYDKHSNTTKVDEARLPLFARKQRPYESIPPTRAALVQHVRRSAFQAAYIWGQSTECIQCNLKVLATGAGKKGEVWEVLWSTLPPIAQPCQQLTNVVAQVNIEDHAKMLSLHPEVHTTV